MHPYIALQLARQKEDQLRRQAEVARLASANRRTRANGLRWLDILTSAVPWTARAARALALPRLAAGTALPGSGARRTR